MFRTTETTAPGPSGVPLIGNAVSLVRNPLEALERWADEYDDDVIRFSFMNEEMFLLTDPEHVRRVLVRDRDSFDRTDFGKDIFGDIETESLSVTEGERWRRQRQLMQPAFYRDRLVRHADVIAQYADDAVDSWGEPFDVQTEMKQLALGVLTKSLFDMDIRGERSVVEETADAMVGRSDRSSINPYLPDWVPTRANRRFDRATVALHDQIEEMIRRRNRTDTTGDDLLSRLIQASERSEASLTDRELRDNIAGMLMKGHDTTAVALTFTWYLLAKNPGVERTLHEELDETLGDRRPTVDDLANLPYTKKVLKESMRYYSPAYIITRRAAVDVTFDGHTVPAGSVVVLPQWIIHHDDRWYDDPEAFRPERWTDEFEAALPEYAYFPFGGGPRRCIATSFANLELQLIVATVANRVSLKFAADDELEFAVSFTVHPKNDVLMRPAPRN